MGTMIVARLSISYDRGTRRNSASDLGIDSKTKTEKGGLIRGLGSHFRSEEAKKLANECSKEEQRIRKAFEGAFMASPLPGIFMVNKSGDARALLATLTIRPDMDARVTEFDLSPREALPEADLSAWAERVDKQLKRVSLGKKKAASDEGLAKLEELSACPILADDTRESIRALLAEAKLQTMARVDIKRKLADIDVRIQVGDQLSPRRAPVLPDPVEETGEQMTLAPLDPTRPSIGIV